MLPGFRFLFAAIVLSMSILVFGLGAAALLRAAHEEVVSAPSWRAVPETIFAQHSDATRPVLASLSVAPAANGQNQGPDSVPNAAAPGAQAATVAAPAAEREPDAALKPDDSSPPEPAKPESRPEDIPAPSEAAPVQGNPAAADTAVIAAAEPTSPPASEAGVASTERASMAAAAERVDASAAIEGAAAPAAAEQASAPVSVDQASAPAAAGQASASAAAEQTGAPARPVTDPAPAKVVTLSSPADSEPPPLATHETTRARSHSRDKKREQAERLARRHRIAQRPHVTAVSSPQPVAPVMPSSFYYSVPHGGS